MNDPRETDLFGHPVRPRKGLRGRPPKTLTPKELDMLEAGLAKGWTNVRLSETLDVPLSTLKRNYGPLLKGRASAPDRLQLAVFATTARKAMTGDMGAVRQLRQMVQEDLVAGIDQRFREAQDGAPEIEEKPRKLGKKEAAAEAAKTAGEGSEWGSLLIPGLH